ncbi:MAG TPA: GreA/GreB family elongation factor, partial [Polyangiaceae bacterium]
MSRAFVKEDSEVAPLVPRRAPLPSGTRNYVTPRGLRLLRTELDGLVVELGARDRDGNASPGELAALRARIAELETRVASAVPVDPTQGAPDIVRFGARVSIRASDGSVRSFRIVGVDEANVEEGSVAFVSPLARALLGKRVGDMAIWKTPRDEAEVEIMAIDFAQVLYPPVVEDEMRAKVSALLQAVVMADGVIRPEERDFVRRASE